MTQTGRRTIDKDWVGVLGTAIWCVLAAAFAIGIAERLGFIPAPLKQWFGYHYLPILAAPAYALLAGRGTSATATSHREMDCSQLLLRGKLIAATVIAVAAVPGQGVFQVTYRYTPPTSAQEVRASTLIDAHLVKLKHLAAGSTIAVMFDPAMPELHAANLGTAI